MKLASHNKCNRNSSHTSTAQAMQFLLLLCLCSTVTWAVTGLRPAVDFSQRPYTPRDFNDRANGRFHPGWGDTVGDLDILQSWEEQDEENGHSGQASPPEKNLVRRRSLQQAQAAAPPPLRDSLPTRTVSGVNLRPGAINVTEMLQGARYPPSTGSPATMAQAPAPAPAPSSDPRLSALALDDGTGASDGTGSGNASGPPLAAIPMLNDSQEVSVNQNPSQLIKQFDGLSAVDTTRLNKLPVEPPNPAVCVGNGYLIEVVNYVLSVYDADNGTRVGGPLDLPSFFGVIGPPENGMSDPYCLFDEPDSRRFFISMMYYTCTSRARPDCSNKPVFSYVLVATSKSDNPLDGFQGPFYVDTSGLSPTTLQPYEGFEACAPPNATSPGCLGDYPTPGMDANALWLGINLFSRIPLSAGIKFVGALVIGVRKLDLISGGRSQPPVAVYSDWSGSPGFTIVPSFTQASNEHNMENGGTVFLVSSDVFTFSGLLKAANGVPAVRVWAITNTSIIAEGFPNGDIPDLSDPVTLYTETLQYPSVEFFDYEDSVAEIQQPSGVALDARDERLRQVAYSNGLLWTCLSTAVSVSGTSVGGLAYFVIDPSYDDDGVFAPTLLNQGYVRAAGSSVINGAFTATRESIGILTGSIFGTGYFMSPFFVRITLDNGPGTIRVPHLSTKELISINGIQIDLRTGDYSTAVLDEQGKVWAVAEYAGSRNGTAFSPTNEANRTLNWATWIMHIDPVSP